MRVLVVEDAKSLADALGKGLREQGYAVDIAYDGEKGLELAEINPYDIIVLDILLPGRDGLSVCRAMREQRLHAPILMLTALDAVENRVEGLDAIILPNLSPLVSCLRG
jgi:DNA-binding response OmpR family regulator